MNITTRAIDYRAGTATAIKRVAERGSIESLHPGKIVVHERNTMLMAKFQY
jgi:hypothetical protein